MPSCNFIPGKKYIVIWNEERYDNVTCWNDGYYNVLGGEGYPFYINDDGGDSLYIEAEEDFTVSIYQDETVIHKIDEKYLPEIIQTEADPTVPSWAKAASKPIYTASEVGAVSYGAQTLTEAQQAQARANIGVEDTGIISLYCDGDYLYKNEDFYYSNRVKKDELLQWINDNKSIIVKNVDSNSTRYMQAVNYSFYESHGEVLFVSLELGGKTAIINLKTSEYYMTNLSITSSNREDFGYTGTEGENFVVPATPYQNTDGKWYKVNKIDSDAFQDCSGLASVDLGSVQSIGSDAFNGCSGLTGTLIIPDSCTNIGYGAFRNCQGLTSVNLGNSVQTISSYAFCDCWGLTETLIIPGSCTSISSTAFQSCVKLPSVVFGNGVQSIGNSAFTSCSGLTSVTIPDSVTSIGKSAFYNCTSLTDVYYTGTEEQWNAISINSTGNDTLIGATIHYNYVPSEAE